MSAFEDFILDLKSRRETALILSAIAAQRRVVAVAVVAAWVVSVAGLARMVPVVLIVVRNR